MKSNPGQQTTIDLDDSLQAGNATLTVGLTLLQHPDRKRVGQIAALLPVGASGSRALSRMEPDFRHPGQDHAEPLLSPLLSRNPLMISISERGTVLLDAQDAALKLCVNGAPFKGKQELRAELLEKGVCIELSDSVVVLLHTVSLADEPENQTGLLGDSLAIRRVRAQIRRVALDPKARVLLRGETGSGKELAARAIHAQSSRRDKRYVTVNLGAIPSSIGAALLFGHEAGAFTGAAKSAPGFFGEARGGTLFLDEIGEAAPELHPLLLRVLREEEVQVVGSSRPQPIDVRTICATDADLEAMVERREFPMALFKRIDGYPIVMPPLRERRDDIARLFFRFLEQELSKAGELHKLDADPARRPWLPTRVLVALLEYEWPGNVAELQLVVQRLVIDNRELPRFELSLELARKLGLDAAASAPSRGKDAAQKRNAGSLSDAEIVQALRANGFRVRPTAAALGVSNTWLNRKLETCVGARKAKALTRKEILAVAQQCGGLNPRAMAPLLEVSDHGLKLRLHDLGLEPGAVP